FYCLIFRGACFILGRMAPNGNQHDDQEPARFVTRQCTRAACGLRFSVQVSAEESAASGGADNSDAPCPLCRAPVRNAAESYERFSVPPLAARPRGPELEVLLDNIRSAWNVGSMLRTADGAGVRHVHLCGVT